MKCRHTRVGAYTVKVIGTGICANVLTLKAPITTAVDDKFCDIFPNFREKNNMSCPVFPVEDLEAYLGFCVAIPEGFTFQN